MSSRNPFKDKIAYWGRYVDDTIVIWDGTSEELNSFLEYLKKCVHYIDFTLEVEESGVLNFLDLKLKRCGNSISYGIYRKPSATDIIIPADSHHLPKYKVAALHSLVHRLLAVPMDRKEYTAELRTIEEIAEANGYTRDIVRRLIVKKSI